MSKFGALALDVASPGRMPIILPGADEPVVDKAGQQAYLEFLPWDSDAGRAIDRKNYNHTVRRATRQGGQPDDEDPIELQVERLTALATGWHLVDASQEVIDVPFSKENARELFSDPETAWLRRAGWVFISNEANFMKRSSKS